MEWKIAGTSSVTIMQEKRNARGTYQVRANIGQQSKTIGFATSDAEASLMADIWLRRHAPEHKIARAFVKVLREWLTREQWKEMRRRNATISPGCCASHDFCDANMAMAEAWETLGLETPCGLEQDATPAQHEAEEMKGRIWSEAWDISMPRLGGKRRA